MRLRLSPDVLPSTLHPLLISAEEGYYILALDEYSLLEHVMAALRAAGSQVLEMQILQPDLEEVFIKTMGGTEIAKSARIAESTALPR